MEDVAVMKKDSFLKRFWKAIDMSDLFRAFFFKLRKDITFRVTLIVGAGVALLMTGLYLMIDSFDPSGAHTLCTGNALFITSFNPSSNFGLAVPINLISFTVLEFNHGIIRNKIVAGNSKLKIYLSLFLTGLVFTLSLLFTYVGLCTALGSIIGGFDPYGIGSLGLVSSALVTPDFIWKFFIANIFVYITITSMTIFFSTLLRNIGPCIPISVLIPIILTTILPIIFQIPDVAEAVGDVPLYLNPFQVIGSPTTEYIDYKGSIRAFISIDNKMMIATTVANVLWTAIFTGFGALIFVKRDVK